MRDQSGVFSGQQACCASETGQTKTLTRPTPVTSGAEGGVLESEVDFGKALHALREGRRVRRTGWNGKGMFLLLMECGRDFHYDQSLWGRGVSPTAVAIPWIALKTAQHSLVPWLASQTDLLARDWEVFV